MAFRDHPTFLGTARAVAAELDTRRDPRPGGANGVLFLPLAVPDARAPDVGGPRAVIVLLLWFCLTSIAILAGAEVNARLEKESPA